MAVGFAVLQHRLFKRDSDMLPILNTPVDIARLWLSCADLMSDAQSVVAYRMMGIGGTWSVPRGENHAMLHEKGPAFTEALLAGTMTALKAQGRMQLQKLRLHHYQRRYVPTESDWPSMDPEIWH
jgi:hypothetical protein